MGGAGETTATRTIIQLLVTTSITSCVELLLDLRERLGAPVDSALPSSMLQDLRIEVAEAGWVLP